VQEGVTLDDVRTIDQLEASRIDRLYKQAARGDDEKGGEEGEDFLQLEVVE